MKKIGLFFGSFNPVHNGHLELATAFREEAQLEEVWVVLTPQNPHKKSSDLASDYHRLEMLKIAFSDLSESIKVSDVELSLSSPYYTANTLDWLEKEYPEINFVILMGSDSLNTLSTWSRYQRILEFPIFVYPRLPLHQSSLLNHDSITMMKFPLVNVSATQIRNMIFTTKSVSEWLPQGVEDYISEHDLYS